MPEPGDLIAWYDHVAAAYDDHRLPLSGRVANLVVHHAAIAEGARVLDVGTGTGNVALTAAQRVGSRGLVIGVDLSKGMLQEARRRAGTLPVEFRQMDAEALEFGDATFDVVVSSLLAGAHIVYVLQEVRRVLRPGGRTIFAWYTDRTHEPLAELAWSRLECHGMARPAASSGPWTALSETERFRSWFEQAGLAETRTFVEPHTFELEGAQDWWAYMRRSTRWGPALARLAPDALERLRADILADIDARRTDGRLEVDGSAVIGIGVRR